MAGVVSVMPARAARSFGSRLERRPCPLFRGKTEHTTGAGQQQVKPRYSRDEEAVDGRVYFRARAGEPAVEGGRTRKARSSFTLHMVLIPGNPSRTPTLTSLRERPLWLIRGCSSYLYLSADCYHHVGPTDQPQRASIKIMLGDR